MPMSFHSTIIGIGGVSRSGKSFLAKGIGDFCSGSGLRVQTLDQDDFVFHGSKIPIINNHVDWECPESIDFVSFKQAISESLKVNDVTIAEGLMVFWDPEILTLFDYKIFIKLPREEFIKRKQADLRWGKEPDWYINHIWESNQKYGQFPEDKNPDVILNGNKLFDVNEIHQKITHPHSNPHS